MPAAGVERSGEKRVVPLDKNGRRDLMGCGGRIEIDG
jgi:hypothetical protein